MPILTLLRAQSVLDLNLLRPAHFLTDELLARVWLHDALVPPTEIHRAFLKPFSICAELHLQLQGCS